MWDDWEPDYCMDLNDEPGGFDEPHEDHDPMEDMDPPEPEGEDIAERDLYLEEIPGF